MMQVGLGAFGVTRQSRGSRQWTPVRSDVDDVQMNVASSRGRGVKRSAPDSAAPSAKRGNRFLPKWKRGRPWLVFDPNKNIMYCSYCETYGDVCVLRSTTAWTQLMWFCLTRQPHRTDQWGNPEKGSKSMRCDAVKNHADSKAHKNAEELYQQAKKERALQGGSLIGGLMGAAVARAQAEQRDKTLNLFRTALYLAKEEVPMVRV